MSESVPIGGIEGPATITVFKVLKQDGAFTKFDDNQQRKWNTNEAEVSLLIKPGVTIDVKWQVMQGTLQDGKTYESKYITKARVYPEGTPAQELKEPYTGGSGGGGNSGGGKGGKADFRTHGELVATDALLAAATLIGPVMPPVMTVDNVTADETLGAAVRIARRLVMETADVMSEYIIRRGAELVGKEGEPTGSADWGDNEKTKDADDWGDNTSGGGQEEDDDIPF